MTLDRRIGVLAAAFGGSLVVAACGGDTTGGGSSSATPTATQTAVCQGTTAPPGYSNGLPTVAGQATSLSGAGGTFVAPMMSIWTGQYATTASVQVAYASVGSGAGIAQLQAGRNFPARWRWQTNKRMFLPKPGS